MSKRASLDFNKVKGTSKRIAEGLKKKREQEEKELLEKLNIPPRDEEKYPMPKEEDMKNAGAFLYTMNLLASSYDGNLQALIWHLYVDLMLCLRNTSGQEELFSMIGTLTYLKEYLAKNGNPLFTDKIS